MNIQRCYACQGYSHVSRDCANRAGVKINIKTGVSLLGDAQRAASGHSAARPRVADGTAARSDHGGDFDDEAHFVADDYESDFGGSGFVCDAFACGVCDTPPAAAAAAPRRRRRRPAGRAQRLPRPDQAALLPRGRLRVGYPQRRQVGTGDASDSSPCHTAPCSWPRAGHRQAYRASRRLFCHHRRRRLVDHRLRLDQAHRAQHVGPRFCHRRQPGRLGARRQSTTSTSCCYRRRHRPR